MNRIQLTQNFYLDEFTRSQAAARRGIEIVVEPDSEVFLNLKRLCTEILQPVRDQLGPVVISSGYRPPRVNRLVGGSTTSAHVHGLAADFIVPGTSPYEVAGWIDRHRKSISSDNGLALNFDQCIHEFGQWVHVGLAPLGIAPRLQALTAYKRSPSIPFTRPKTAYALGIHHIEDLQED